MCKVALPVVLLSPQQTSRLWGRKSLLRRMHKYYDNKSFGARDLDRFKITPSHGLSARKDSYLVNPSDPSTRDTLAFTQEEYVALVREVARCDVGKYICAVELFIDVNCSNKIADAPLRIDLRFLAPAITLSHKENRMAHECVRLNL
ncbi:hypothetical protein As57867_006418, partial [Aphanomyces stellatus]